MGELDERLHNMRRISVSGTIIDVFPDDVDAITHFLLIKERDTILPVSVTAQDLPKLGTVINAEVKLTGTYEKSIIGRRKFSGPYISLTDAKDLVIIRELTVNAIRHGKARHVTIRGQLASRTLTFSVADDGCGFDPGNRPGMEEGHFGLLGVCERLNKLGGRMDISSVIGKGTTVSIIIECEHEEDTRANR